MSVSLGHKNECIILAAIKVFQQNCCKHSPGTLDKNDGGSTSSADSFLSLSAPSLPERLNPSTVRQIPSL